MNTVNSSSKADLVFSVIQERHSTRKFLSDPVPQENIQKIIDAGLLAPSGHNWQSPIILAITDKEMRDQFSRENCSIGGWKEGFDPFYGAPVILTVLADKSIPSHVRDGSCTMENMMLMAEALGLGSIWINRAEEEFNSAFGRTILDDLGIEGEYEGIGHVALGYEDPEFKRAEKKIRENRVYYLD